MIATKFAYNHIWKKSSSCVQLLNWSDITDTFFFGIAIALYTKISHQNMQKNQHPLLHQKIKQKNLDFCEQLFPISVTISGLL